MHAKSQKWIYDVNITENDTLGSKSQNFVELSLSA